MLKKQSDLEAGAEGVVLEDMEKKEVKPDEM